MNDFVIPVPNLSCQVQLRNLGEKTTFCCSKHVFTFYLINFPFKSKGAQFLELVFLERYVLLVPMLSFLEAPLKNGTHNISSLENCSLRIIIITFISGLANLGWQIFVKVSISAILKQPFFKVYLKATPLQPVVTTRIP